MLQAMDAFECSNASCSARGPVAAEGNRLRCRACGQPVSPRQGIRGYAKQTGQWFIGAGALFATGFAGSEGWVSHALAAGGGAIAVYAIYRVVHQAKLLKRFE